MTDRKTLLTFPTEFTLKVFGKLGVDFEGAVLGIVKKHVPKLGEGAIKTQPSKGDKYLSMSITITAESQKQLDAIYQDLSNTPEVMMAL